MNDSISPENLFGFIKLFLAIEISRKHAELFALSQISSGKNFMSVTLREVESSGSTIKIYPTKLGKLETEI